MIQTIIDDAKAVEAEAIKSEAELDAQYESFVKDSNASIESKGKEIVMKTAAKAKAEQDKVKAEQSLEEVVAELDGLSAENADLHKQCDFTLKNFEIRQTARDEEIEALKMVKQILSGAKFSDFLQSDAFANDDSSPVETDVDSDTNVDPLQAFLDSP